MSSAEPVIVLVGPMGAGKSSIGRRVARALRTPFTDTDKAIAAAHGPIPEIFATAGEAQFRAWEHEAVRAALGRGGVIALGGGAVLDDDTRMLLRAVPVVLLTVTAEAVGSRIRGQGRPLLSGEEDPLTRWSTILAEREPLYREVADATFDTSRMPMSKVADGIAEWMKGRG